MAYFLLRGLVPLICVVGSCGLRWEVVYESMLVFCSDVYCVFVFSQGPPFKRDGSSQGIILQ